jgi:hypothetical protein
MNELSRYVFQFIEKTVIEPSETVVKRVENNEYTGGEDRNINDRTSQYKVYNDVLAEKKYNLNDDIESCMLFRLNQDVVKRRVIPLLKGGDDADKMPKITGDKNTQLCDIV